jgi:hypothetical protein
LKGIMQTKALPKNQPAAAANGRRGFSSMEKWVIWAVFCLLVGLSSRLIVFPALLLISWGAVRYRWYMREKIIWQQRWPAVIVFLLGVGMVLQTIIKP